MMTRLSNYQKATKSINFKQQDDYLQLVKKTDDKTIGGKEEDQYL